VMAMSYLSQVDGDETIAPGGNWGIYYGRRSHSLSAVDVVGIATSLRMDFNGRAGNDWLAGGCDGSRLNRSGA
jgi:hypothetical protein